MYKQLPSGVKSSITRSISIVFEKYMASIEWAEDRFSMEDFSQEWGKYIKSASWKDKVSQESMLHPDFHEEIAKKINQVIDKILNEPPSEDQIAKIEIMQEQLNTHYDYACKAEASYVESILKQKVIT
ncbi:hypothetical protein [Paenisporosarcina indica]|uniref:hypothetical protein n=1 Tax=Paenisporosarcina indica TaxID=650093 RepID=UPI00094F8BF8|nr:hypothetical protein [Paenisporosarcina indica]